MTSSNAPLPMMSDTVAVGTFNVAESIRNAIHEVLINDDELCRKVLGYLYPLGITGNKQGDQYLAAHFILEAIEMREKHDIRERDILAYMFTVLRKNGYLIAGGRVVGHLAMEDKSNRHETDD